MKSTVFTIMKKELRRFLCDRRMLITLLLPGLLIYVLYSLIGGALGDQMSGKREKPYQIAVVSQSALTAPIMEALTLEDGETPLFSAREIDPADTSAIEAAKHAVKEEALHLLVVYPAGFDETVMRVGELDGVQAPDIVIWHNSASTDSAEAYTIYLEALNTFESMLANRFDVNAGEEMYDLADERDVSGMIFSMMMPMLIVMLLFSGCMATAPESIAGEKERGTIATLLITPMKRRDLAIGKILGLSIVSLISGTSSFLGVMLSLPRLMGGADVSGAYYEVSDYIILLAVMLSAVLLFVSIISVLSAFAKSVKEASTLLVPVMLVVVLLGVSGMFGGAPESLALYFIPIYGTVQVISAVFAFSIAIPMVVAAVVVNLAVTAALILLLTRMFNSERIMFSK